MDSIQWQAFIKSCLDILRNGFSKFDGLKAINEFVTLITLKLIENRITPETGSMSDENHNIPIGEDCKMTNLYNEYCAPDKLKNKSIYYDKLLFDLIYNAGRIWDIKQDVTDELEVKSEVRTRNNKNS